MYCLSVVEVLELPWVEIEHKDIFVVDCETSDELVDVQKFGIHDETEDEKQPCC